MWRAVRFALSPTAARFRSLSANGTLPVMTGSANASHSSLRVDDVHRILLRLVPMDPGLITTSQGNGGEVVAQLLEALDQRKLRAEEIVQTVERLPEMVSSEVGMRVAFSSPPVIVLVPVSAPPPPPKTPPPPSPSSPRSQDIARVGLVLDGGEQVDGGRALIYGLVSASAVCVLLIFLLLATVLYRRKRKQAEHKLQQQAKAVAFSLEQADHTRKENAALAALASGEGPAALLGIRKQPSLMATFAPKNGQQRRPSREERTSKEEEIDIGFVTEELEGLMSIRRAVDERQRRLELRREQVRSVDDLLQRQQSREHSACSCQAPFGSTAANQALVRDHARSHAMDARRRARAQMEQKAVDSEGEGGGVAAPLDPITDTIRIAAVSGGRLPPAEFASPALSLSKQVSRDDDHEEGRRDPHVWLQRTMSTSSLPIAESGSASGAVQAARMARVRSAARLQRSQSEETSATDSARAARMSRVRAAARLHRDSPSGESPLQDHRAADSSSAKSGSPFKDDLTTRRLSLSSGTDLPGKPQRRPPRSLAEIRSARAAKGGESPNASRKAAAAETEHVRLDPLTDALHTASMCGVLPPPPPKPSRNVDPVLATREVSARIARIRREHQQRRASMATVLSPEPSATGDNLYATPDSTKSRALNWLQGVAADDTRSSTQCSDSTKTRALSWLEGVAGEIEDACSAPGTPTSSPRSSPTTQHSSSSTEYGTPESSKGS